MVVRDSPTLKRLQVLSEMKGERWIRRYQQHGSADFDERSHASIPSVLKVEK
jgi:hypothetical protein